jgi:hypothetical protein
MNRRPAILALAALLACAGGCTSRFTAKTQYLAPGFSRASLRGKTVAVMPVSSPSAAGAEGYNEALAGIARGMGEEGARARLVPPARDTADPAALLAAARSAGAADAAYLLLVRITGAGPYRAYAPGRYDGPAGRPTATRTAGRRVGMDLALVRAADGAPLWSARGTGDAWRTRTDVAPRATAAATLDEDLRGGNAHFYPPPPAAQDLTIRLVRRLIARVPVETALEPN